MMQGKKIIVSGLVQGVSFRHYTNREANRLQLCGTVRNLPSYQVEVFVYGEETTLAEFIQWLWQGSPASKVKDLAIEPWSPLTPPTTFQVLP